MFQRTCCSLFRPPPKNLPSSSSSPSSTSGASVRSALANCHVCSRADQGHIPSPHPLPRPPSQLCPFLSRLLQLAAYRKKGHRQLLDIASVVLQVSLPSNGRPKLDLPGAGASGNLRLLPAPEGSAGSLNILSTSIVVYLATRLSRTGAL